MPIGEGLTWVTLIVCGLLVVLLAVDWAICYVRDKVKTKSEEG